MKDFDGPALERRLNAPRVPIEDRQFTVAGETLVYANTVPAQAVIGLGVALRSGDEMRAARAVTDAIMALLDRSCHEAFGVAVEKTFPDVGEDGEPHPLAGEYVMDRDMLTEMYRWLMSTVSSRPPTKRSTSQPPSTTNGTPSTPESHSAEQTSTI